MERGGQWRRFLPGIFLVVLYVLLGNARSVQPNPFIPGAVIAVNMIIPVIAGILFGVRTGLAVGFFGTLLNALSPIGNLFEYLSIIPHLIMGGTAGLLKGKIPSPYIALTILIGHSLNLTLYWLFGLIPETLFGSLVFWYGIGYEALIGIVVIIVLTAVYRMGIERNS